MSRHHMLDAAHAGTYQLGAKKVARVGYGAMHLERLADRRADAIALLRRAIELGVDHVDTAEFYGDGFVNDVIREVVATERHVVVVSKVGAEPNPEGPIPIRPAQRPEQLRASVERNLRSLGVEQLPVVNLRRLDVAPGLSAAGDQVVDVDDQMALMITLRDEGKIGAIGLSSVDRDILNRALPAGIACLQNAYSLLSRQYEDLLDVCVENGIAWVPFFPLGGAFFPDWPKVTDHPGVVEIAARLGIAPSQLGLAWLLAHQPNVMLIPGTSSADHLQQNIATASLALADEVVAEMDALPGVVRSRSSGGAALAATHRPEGHGPA